MNHHRDGQKPVEQTETLWAFELFAEELPKQVDFTHLSSLAVRRVSDVLVRTRQQPRSARSCQTEQTSTIFGTLMPEHSNTRSYKEEKYEDERYHSKSVGPTCGQPASF